ncbi:hypothetical protein T265_04715 [Opisthorchis viverrini]|uniref:Uncharacterized protein n=1 Tax=Opisthorchis viverrini TaxID=6198 RepID=A0A074ZM76_OPIVI|nr:hypothetical protein T265_04715 [Opisthorchis viverrini]KER28493.1 hypothetical protein T265_04715 [Opisthorchis viverrini]
MSNANSIINPSSSAQNDRRQFGNAAYHGTHYVHVLLSFRPLYSEMKVLNKTSAFIGQFGQLEGMPQITLVDFEGPGDGEGFRRKQQPHSVSTDLINGSKEGRCQWDNMRKIGAAIHSLNRHLEQWAEHFQEQFTWSPSIQPLKEPTDPKETTTPTHHQQQKSSARLQSRSATRHLARMFYASRSSNKVVRF